MAIFNQNPDYSEPQTLTKHVIGVPDGPVAKAGYDEVATGAAILLAAVLVAVVFLKWAKKQNRHTA